MTNKTFKVIKNERLNSYKKSPCRQIVLAECETYEEALAKAKELKKTLNDEHIFPVWQPGTIGSGAYRYTGAYR